MRDELFYVLERCNIRIIAEQLGSHRQISSFMHRKGSFLLKQPDLIVPDLDGPRYFILFDVKIFDPAAPSYSPMPTRQPNPLNTAIEL